jgi:hypothetical protein
MRLSRLGVIVLVSGLLMGCSSAGSPSGEPSGIADQSPVYQQDVQTCNAFGEYLLNEVNDVAVYDDANGGNGITVLDPAVSPALQALVNKWDAEVNDWYDNNGNNETTGPAVEKTDHLVTEYGNQIEAWCSAHAGVNLAEIQPSDYPPTPG